MKLFSRIFTPLVCCFMLSVGYAQKAPTQFLLMPLSDTSTQVVSYTLDALAVIDGKCLGCHSPTGRSDDARDALQWELLQEADATDAYATLDEIIEVLDEGSMPPEKIVKKYPGMKLTEEETATLKNWAESVLTRLEE